MKNRKGCWRVVFLAFLVVSLAIFSPVYAEEEIPFIELKAVEPLTQEEKELRELRRFTRGLKELLQEKKREWLSKMESILM